MNPKKPSTNDYTLKEAINRLIEQYKLAAGLREHKMKELWKEIAGPYIADRTENVMLQGSVLKIKISSPALRQELWMNRDEILARFQAHVGRDSITAIRFI